MKDRKKEYKTLYRKYDFKLKISYGYFNEFESGFKSWVAKQLNLLLYLLGNHAKILSPFMILVGKK